MNFHDEARNIQSIGARNAKGDTILAHITPKEAAILKLLGGSGRKDPQTGAFHFAMTNEGDDGGDYDNSSDDNDTPSNDRPENHRGDPRAYGDTPEERDWESVKRDIQSLPEEADDDPGWMRREMESYKKSGYDPNFDPTDYNNTRGMNTVPRTAEQIAAQQQNYNNTMDFNRQAQENAKPKNPFGWGDLVTGAAGLVTGTPTGFLKSVPKAVSYAGDLHRWNAENERLGLTGPSTSQPRAEHESGNGAGKAVGLGLLGAGAYGLSQSGKGQQMYTDPVTGQLLPYLDSGLNERVANENLQNTVSNQIRSSDALNARRGMGMSTMADAMRANLGLSTAQGMNQNRLTSQEIAAQRDLAAQTQAKQDALAQQNLRYLQGVQDDANRNAWIKTAGDVAGSIDWGSLF